MKNLPVSEASVTVENCAAEPIHVPSSIQPHGLLLVLSEEDHLIRQVGANVATLLQRTPESLLNQPLNYLLGDEPYARLLEKLEGMDARHQNPFLRNINPFDVSIAVNQQLVAFEGILHSTSGGLVLELEPVQDRQELSFQMFYDLSRRSLLALQSTDSLEALYHTSAREVHRLTGFDRVMIYRFDKEWNGQVIAESGNDSIDSFLGLHFPATDIPDQARALYMKNWLRFIPDVRYQPAPLVPALNPMTQQPLDMTYSVLRSVSPIHLEYLTNMGVHATLTISLIKDNQLWGLIACHHLTPRYIPYQVRIASEYIGQILSLQLALKQKEDNRGIELRLRKIHTTLLENIAKEQEYLRSFAAVASETLALTDARGAAICHEGKISLIGKTPPEADVAALLTWLKTQLTETDYLMATASLSAQFAPARAYATVASGLLAVQIAKPQQSYILWFRPEAVQEVRWGGKPDKFVVQEDDGKLRLHPRQSFAQWKEKTRQVSSDWQDHHITIAKELRNAIKDVFIFKAEEYRAQKEALEKLNQNLKREMHMRQQLQHKLERSNAELERFAYVASHDLQEPLRATSNFSSLLKRRYEDQLDDRAKKYIHFIVDGTARMQTLINDILAYSRLETKEKVHEPVDMNRVLQEVTQNLQAAIDAHCVKITASSLPTVTGDAKQLGQLLQNLIGNAIKYGRKEKPCQVHVEANRQDGHWEFAVSDNGIGIEKQYFDRIFVVFQRLHNAQEYPGTGIGLAICKRIVEQHQGKIWLTSEIDAGTTFYFTLPINDEQH